MLRQGLYFTPQVSFSKFLPKTQSCFSKLKMQKLTILLWAIISLGVVLYPQPRLFSFCIDAQRWASYYLQNIMLQFYICYHKNYYATWTILEKLCHIKSNINFRADPQQSVGSKTVFYPIRIMTKIFSKDPGNLITPPYTITNNITVSHLVSCREIPRPSTMKEWDKEVFWKIHALGNLKCNQNNIA